jgi:leucyl aminopeptidase
MQITFSSATSIGEGALVLGATDGPVLLPASQKADKALRGAISRALKNSRFKGKSGQMIEVSVPEDCPASHILLVGLGVAAELNGQSVEIMAANAAGRLSGLGDASANFQIDVPKGSKLKPVSIACHIGLGAKLKSYSFSKYRTKDVADQEFRLKTVTIATADVPGARKGWAHMATIVDGVFLARDLVNEPPNILYPAEFARRVKSLTKLGVKVEVLGEAQMKKLGMNMLLAVGQGSERESQLVVMQWNGARNKKAQPIAFVGKGVCFDSGGLSLKPGGSMMGMKGDMGGAAAVVGTMQTLAARKAKVNAVGVIGLVENMPDGKAQRPDDVVVTMSGQTVEVLNTDAEGRLVLGDALWYTKERFKPHFMVNLATLTGAIIMALGNEYAGVFSNNDELSERISAAGGRVGEKVWRFPLAPAYDNLLRSKIADMKNIGGPSAGSITAAQFLQRFVDKTPWAHLDIAGVAWQDGEQKPLIPSWGTGWGVRLLNRLVNDHYEGK